MSRSALGAAGFVLAGGASRRMGQDKALLVDGELPLLARVASVVTAAAGNCRVVAPVGRYEDFGFPVLPDRWPGEGPLGGIVTALQASTADRNLILAVDMPFIDLAFLQLLLAEAAQGAETVVPVHADGNVEPLCGVYRAIALPALARFFDNGGRRVKDALREIDVRTIPAPERLLANVNTPEQWEAARS